MTSKTSLPYLKTFYVQHESDNSLGDLWTFFSWKYAYTN